MYQIIAENKEISIKNIKQWILEFRTRILPLRKRLGDYYDGNNDIIKQGAVEDRPNYKFNVNMAKYIVDVATGYAFGVPITYTCEDEKIKTVLDKIEKFHKNIHSDEIDFQIGGDLATFGVGYQLFAVNKGSEPIENRMYLKRLNPLNTFYVIDNTIEEKPICAVHYQYFTENNITKLRVYVYDNEYQYLFIGNDNLLKLQEKEAHNLGIIPIIQALNNDDGFGDFQQITGLLDGLSLAISNNADDLQSISNAILAVSGATLNEEQIKLINKYKVGNLPLGAKMEWITKNISPDAEKLHIDNLLKFIFQISQVPDLTDDSFGGNQSGVAMRYKLWGLDQLWQTKTKKYKRAVIERLKLLLHILKYSVTADYNIINNINITFTKNLPLDESPEYERVKALRGLVSDKTLLANLSIVNNVDYELEEIAKQEEKQADLYGYNNNSILNNSEDEINE